MLCFHDTLKSTEPGYLCYTQTRTMQMLGHVRLQGLAPVLLTSPRCFLEYPVGTMTPPLACRDAPVGRGWQQQWWQTSVPGTKTKAALNNFNKGDNNQMTGYPRTPSLVLQYL